MPISISQTWNVIFVGDKDLWQCDSWASEGWSLELWEGGMSQSGQTFIQGAHITHPQSPFHSETISSHVLQHFRPKINHFTMSYGFNGFFSGQLCFDHSKCFLWNMILLACWELPLLAPSVLSAELPIRNWSILTKSDKGYDIATAPIRIRDI